MPITTDQQLADQLIHLMASRREQLDVIRRFGNRFENWLKWELAIGFHHSSHVVEAASFQAIAVERGHSSDSSKQNCDLVLCAEAWPEEAIYPSEHDLDVWIELKARSTSDKAAADLADGVWADIERQRLRKKAGRGLFACAALVTQSPWKRSYVNDWMANVRDRIGLKVAVRTLAADSVIASSQGGPLAGLLVWVV